MNCFRALRAKRAFAVIFPVCSLRLLPSRSEAATISNYLSPAEGWPQMSLAINVGDTMVWVNQQACWPTNYVESYGGEWKSPVLAPGDSFSFTFTNAGFYAYRTALYIPGMTPVIGVGSVAVSAWTSAPPALTINSPMEGFIFPPGWSPVLVQASVLDPAVITGVQYFAKGSLIGAGQAS